MNPDPSWEIRENQPPLAGSGRMETLFSLANGFLGMRGDFEEASPSERRGTYINGYFEKTPITYGEHAFGYAVNHQTILNLPDARIVRLFIDGEEFSMDRGTCISYERFLDLRTGRLIRRLTWRLQNGREFELEVRRIVSLTRASVAGLRYAVRLLPDAQPSAAGNEPAALRIVTTVNLAARNVDAEDDPRVGAKFEGRAFTITAHDCRHEGAVSAELRTHNSGLTMVCGARNRLYAAGHPVLPARCGRTSETLDTVYEFALAPGADLVLERILYYSTEGDAGSAHQELEMLSDSGYDLLEREQANYMQAFWHGADVAIEGNPSIAQAARFNIFHILQSAGKDGKRNLAAKGLSGEGYEGHFFWDTEIYALPLFTYTDPEVARSLLEYRHSILPQARSRAALLSHRGALFPWRTIDGEECSAYYPAGTAQYHINADIVYALHRYIEATGDIRFLHEKGAEIAVETSRFWLSLGSYGGEGSGDKKGKFCINTVTGPDEYTALVNNNVYTNLMAAHNMAWAADLVVRMRTEAPEAYRLLAEKIGLSAEEPDEWKRAAEAIYIPYDAERGLFQQDDTFFSKAVWDFAGTPRDRYPLLLHYHPLTIYRHQVLKQPDLVLAMFLLGGRFGQAEKRRNFAYYEALTTGDSSLSHCIQSIMAAEIGKHDKAWDYFLRTVRLDLDDLHGNVVDGIHAAAMAGTWLSLIYGFAGFREGFGTEPVYSFSPHLPDALTGLRFRLKIRGSLLEVDISREMVRYRLVEGPGLSFRHRYDIVRLGGSDGAEARFGLVPQSAGAVFDLRTVSFTGDKGNQGDLRSGIASYCAGLRSEGKKIVLILDRESQSFAEAIPCDSLVDGDGYRAPPAEDLVFAAADAIRMWYRDCSLYSNDMLLRDTARAAGLSIADLPIDLPQTGSIRTAGSLPEGGPEVARTVTGLQKGTMRDAR